jgi:hypothetical protein
MWMKYSGWKTYKENTLHRAKIKYVCPEVKGIGTSFYYYPKDRIIIHGMVNTKLQEQVAKACTGMNYVRLEPTDKSLRTMQ